MSSVIQFFADWLILFIIGTVVFLFALIGYFIENGFKGKQILKSVSVEKPSEELMSEQLKDKVANANQSLSDLMQGGSGSNEQGLGTSPAVQTAQVIQSVQPVQSVPVDNSAAQVAPAVAVNPGVVSNPGQSEQL